MVRESFLEEVTFNLRFAGVSQVNSDEYTLGRRERMYKWFQPEKILSVPESKRGPVLKYSEEEED